MLKIRNVLMLIFAGLITACVHLPSGPSVMALPGAGKNFDQFRFDDKECRQYAIEQIGDYTPRRAAKMSGVESAAIGTGLGAAAGAAIAGGHGAAVGAGVGLLFGSLMGTSTASTSNYANQDRYDISYIQCMYAKGNRVPVNGRIVNGQPDNRSAAKKISAHPTNFVPPPPPPGNPPPPPPSQRF
ncbi:MAG: hypothetical protein DYH15_08830 [Nitrosomonas sp. PRO4]|nr:hypothetical protein [Nitrosomonas sp. PRO4]